MYAKQVDSADGRQGMETGASPTESSTSNLDEEDCSFLERAAGISTSNVGKVAPHPYAGCVICSSERKVVAESFQYAQGTQSAEELAIELAGTSAEGSTAYLNLESTFGIGQERPVQSLIDAKVKRVVFGIRHPLVHLRGQAVEALRIAGIRVDVLQDDIADDVGESGCLYDTLRKCYLANEHVLHFVAKKQPLCIFKYAMTLDGKTASRSGHASWISGTSSRQKVYALRATCDAVVVGGQTVRSDNPYLTTRTSEGHIPSRVVITRSLDLPTDRNLWNVDVAPTIVITEKGSNPKLVHTLRRKGVEVVEIQDLTPKSIVSHFYDRGFLKVLWECGGKLAASCIAQKVINKLMVFVAPKIIGGEKAPTPVGGLGLQSMTDALDVTDVSYTTVNGDILSVGYLPVSGSPFKVAEEAYTVEQGEGGEEAEEAGEAEEEEEEEEDGNKEDDLIQFYKAWNEYGVLSNFCCFPISMELNGKQVTWRSVEHFYQAQKFSGINSSEAEYIIHEIASAASAEEAARIGRHNQMINPHLLRQDWEEAKVGVMRKAVQAKFAYNSDPWHLLQSTCRERRDCKLIEYSPRDAFWGSGIDGLGQNWLGQILMEIRDNGVAADPGASAA